MIRPATAADAPAIAAIQNALIRDTTVTFAGVEVPAEAMAARIAASLTCVVATRDGQVQGFARAFPFRPGEGYRRTAEWTVSLTAGAVGQGTGRDLLRAVEAGLRAQGVRVLVAAISAENKAGLAFHTACGFATSGRMPGVGEKFGRAIGLILMQKSL